MRTWAPCICCCFVDYPYKIVPQSYAGIYQKFGRYVRTVTPGLHYINPCTETLGMISLKINVLDLARQVTSPTFRTSSPRTTSPSTSMQQSTSEWSTRVTPTTASRTSTSPLRRSPTPSSRTPADSSSCRTCWRRGRKLPMISRSRWTNTLSSGVWT